MALNRNILGNKMLLRGAWVDIEQPTEADGATEAAAESSSTLQFEVVRVLRVAADNAAADVADYTVRPPYDSLLRPLLHPMKPMNPSCDSSSTL